MNVKQIKKLMATKKKKIQTHQTHRARLTERKTSDERYAYFDG